MKKIIYLWLALGATALAGNVLVDNTTKVLTSPTAAQFYAANPPVTGYNNPTGYLGSDKLVTTGTDGTMRADIDAADTLLITPITSGAGGIIVGNSGAGDIYHIAGGATLSSGAGQVISLSASAGHIYSQDALAFDIFNRTLNGLDGGLAIDFEDQAAIALYSAIIGDGAGNASIDSVERTGNTTDGVVFAWVDGILEFGTPSEHAFKVGLNATDITANRTWSIQDKGGTFAGLDDTVAEVFSSAPTTGSTVNPTYTKSKSLVALTPAGSLLALTVNMPNAATYPGGTWTLHSTQIITGLTLTPAGGSVIGATTTFAAVNGSCTYMSDGTDWRKVSGM